MPGKNISDFYWGGKKIKIMLSEVKKKTRIERENRVLTSTFCGLAHVVEPVFCNKGNTGLPGAQEGESCTP